MSSSYNVSQPYPSRGTSAHGRLHKRGNSDSSFTSPTPPYANEMLRHSTESRRTEELRATYGDLVRETRPSLDSQRSGHGSRGLKIKPYIRKLATNDSHGKINMSRSEQERLAGLGINADYHFGPTPRASDVNFAPMSRSRHSRTRSSNSQFSASSSPYRPSAPFVHPMKQTPSAYTPPYARSNPISVADTDPDEITPVTGDDEALRSVRVAFADGEMNGTFHSTPHSHTPSATPSLTRLPHTHPNPSQSSIRSGSVPNHAFPRPRGNTHASVDTATTNGTPNTNNSMAVFSTSTAATSNIPATSSTRTSFDKASSIAHSFTHPFSFSRTRTADTASSSPVDPNTERAQDIARLRAAFAEREEAKERKYEAEERRAREREAKKEHRRRESTERHQRSHERRLESEERKRKRSAERQSRKAREREWSREDKEQKKNKKKKGVESEAEKKTEVEGLEHANFPSYSETAVSMPIRGRPISAMNEKEEYVEFTGQGKRGGGFKRTWFGFLAWFRTRLLRLGIRLSGKH
ncbi:hypothetical protein P152DRAFT_451069 [Eremomyces bilateralis CBS 781.70]|uniref:Uncharacterized protein n=1 Tax=Eremomyces bilateralis CBS 781.70 TaxID=1392243 RepID=A0A6G1FXV7_9PEZI|nr:uncharacterized protein P152DRAFT_451069 [Eremomyces bilateralis CBS 781.70]KAF1810715.1 hypothetical protein P152DRAFT_451069 [Eremomyces bilateralis CBS 781.70]